MSKIIKFGSKDDTLNYPKPASKFIPEWYKKSEKFIGGKPSLDPNDSPNGLATIKACSPFLDSLTSGYMIELWQDIQVKVVDGKPSIFWGSSPAVASERNMNTLQNIPIGTEYHEVHYAWKEPFNVKLPIGYSFLITHPLNHFDLPFTTFSGIVDADVVLVDGQIPFLLKKGFEGTIPQGTPIAQIIPFKRDDWKSEIDNSIAQEADKLMIKLRRVTTGYYKNNIWKNKKYR